MATWRDSSRAVVLFLAMGAPVLAQPAGTAFTYQGRLSDNGTAVTGPYDLQFMLYTAAVGGTAVGAIITVNDVAVTNGLFTVVLDFGAFAFTGSARFLEIGVRPGASTGAFTLLTARQEIKPAPHTFFAQTAPWAGLTGVPPGFADGVENDSGGDITGVTVGTGLTGGGTSGALSIGLDFPALTLNHNHFGQVWNGSQVSGLDINNSAATGAALRASATATTGTGVGVLGTTASTNGRALHGIALSTAGTPTAIVGETSAPFSTAVQGLTLATSGAATGVWGQSAGSAGRGVFGWASSTAGSSYGVFGQTASSGGHGVQGQVTATNGTTAGVHGVSASTAGAGVRAQAIAAAGNTLGVDAYVFSPEGFAIRGQASAGTGLTIGVLGVVASSGGVGVYGLQAGTSGYAGWFDGAVHVDGSLSKAAGSFKIDHPLDPENKYLYHSFVESPEMMNVYAGNVVTDADGFATVTMPDWFEALNRDFRYQLTVLDEGDSAVFAQAKVVRKIAGNRFTIRTSAPRVEVSWLVAGVRHDAYAEAHRIPVEEWKPDERRGRYIHPQEWGRTKERGEDWERLQQLTRRPDPVPPIGQ